MWPVERPEIDAGETFQTCISRVRDLHLRRRLISVRPDIEAAAADYELKAADGDLHLIVTADSVGAILIRFVVATWGCYKSPLVALSHFGTLKVSRS